MSGTEALTNAQQSAAAIALAPRMLMLTEKWKRGCGPVKVLVLCIWAPVLCIEYIVYAYIMYWAHLPFLLYSRGSGSPLYSYICV